MRAHDMVRDGAIGEPFLIDVDYWHSRTRPDLYRRRSTGGSALLLGGCHAIDTACFITGLAPVEVVARSAAVPASGEEWYEFDCAEMCLVRYSNGAVGRISAVVTGVFPYQFNIDVLGGSGSMRNNRVFLQGDREKAGFRILSDPGPDSGNVAEHPFTGLIRHFLDSIADERESDVSVEESVLTHELCFAALLSARTGEPVRLPLALQDQQAIHDLLASFV